MTPDDIKALKADIFDELSKILIHSRTYAQGCFSENMVAVVDHESFRDEIKTRIDELRRDLAR